MSLCGYLKYRQINVKVFKIPPADRYFLSIQAAAIQFTKEPKSQDALHGRSAMLRCEVSDPADISYGWLHNGQPLESSERRFQEGSNLKFTAVDQQLDAGNFECVAENAVTGEMLHSTNASFNIKWLESGGVTLKEPTSEGEIESSAPVTLRCHIDGHPRPTCQWFKDGVKLTEKSHQINNKERTLTFKSANKSFPRPVVTPEDQVVLRNEEAMFHCQFTAVPAPTLEWYHENELLANKSRVFLLSNGTLLITQIFDPKKDSRFKLFSNGTLRINNVEVYDGQMYGCEAKTVGGRLSGQARVNVLEKLKFTPTPQPSQCLELDNQITIQCSAKGRESPTIRWTKADGGELPPRVEQRNGQLHFTKVTRSDAGNYTCIASNSLQGEIRALVTLTVAVYIRFKVDPENTTVYQGHTAILHCQATGDPEPHIHWMVKDKTLDISKNRRIQKMPNGSLVIRDVTTDDTGRYTCVAGNSCSIKDRVAQLYVVDKPVHSDGEDLDKAPYKMIQTIGLSVGAAVAYIIVVLGLMFYCKKRRNAKRLHKGQDGEEPEMECLNGGTVQQNGNHTTTEIQEEVALTNMGTMATTEKRHSHVNNDKLHFPRANLQTITTLGKGEFGEVLLSKAKGIEESEEETVVLVKSLQTRDEQLQLDFRREAEMFAKLSHPNVVRLLGLCREAEPSYMILEYYDLGDLKQFLRISKSKDDKIKSQPISTKTKVSICAQLAHGMEHLSNHRFVHKDLAARNCLINSQRRVKVSSLSLSKDVYNSEYYHYRQAWIPLRWLPSESVFEDDVSTKSDVWAFGVLMWEVFSHGEMPYTKLSDDEVLEALQTGKLKLPVPDGCPSKIYKLMARCWALSLKERPSFTDIVHALGELPSDSKV
ncbi:hypothetical protein F2P81_020015 [Scophthalmus maximus]|uniref:Inactive tyrosine-protein kinase 7 n=1 Tax=Scophthalmus maximus TaxID=52904 RepID=A0A6A4S9C4_SCOMX|nr:hypothetical protein F2P81_020015 [Scophthalmus maximus]